MSFDASVPNAAQVHGFFLGKDNYAAGREQAGESWLVSGGAGSAAIGPRSPSAR
jgi:hypothetical protein